MHRDQNSSCQPLVATPESVVFWHYSVDDVYFTILSVTNISIDSACISWVSQQENAQN